MTHEELLAKVDKWEYSDYQAIGTISDWPYKIIRAIIKLHSPNVGYPNPDELICSECKNEIEDILYPCPTIQAIEKELI